MARGHEGMEDEPKAPDSDKARIENNHFIRVEVNRVSYTFMPRPPVRAYQTQFLPLHVSPKLRAFPHWSY